MAVLTVVGAFPDSHSALMLCVIRLRQVAGTNWRSRKYLNMDLLLEQELSLKFEPGEAIQYQNERSTIDGLALL